MYCQGSLQDKPLSQREHSSLLELTSVHSPELYVHTADREGGERGGGKKQARERERERASDRGGEEQCNCECVHVLVRHLVLPFPC